MIARRVFPALILLASASAQSLSVGLIGGGALTDAFGNDNAAPGAVHTWSQSKDFLAGAALEFRLPARFSIEADGIYRELHLTLAFIEANGTPNSVSPAPVVTWEFPVLGKYRFHFANVEPFVEAGPAFRTTGNLNANPSHTGIAAGAGVAMRWRGFEIAPTLRYTRWERDPHDLYAESKSDQLEVLVAVSRESRLVSHPLGGRFTIGALVGTNLTPDFPSFQNPYISYEPVLQPGGGYIAVMSNGTVYQAGRQSVVTGPKIEIALAYGLGIEADALYHPLRESVVYVAASGMGLPSSTNGVSVWELPLLAKYRVGRGKFRPVVASGPAFRLPAAHLSTRGISVGGGIEARWGALRITPELRYTHWGVANPAPSAGGVEQNQLLFLTSFAL